MDLSSLQINPFTLIYLIKDKKVLLIKRLPTKKLLGGKILGLGGKIEPGEDILDSARREFLEETGLKLLNPVFKGTYTWIDGDFIGISHLIVATKYTGKILMKSAEGELKWYGVDEINSLEDLADYQKKFLPDILNQDITHYTCIEIFNNDGSASHADSKNYFLNRDKEFTD